jgi:hypothetical protein
MAETSDYSKCLQAAGEGVVVRVRLQPRASKDEIATTAGDCLKIRVKAPPVEGAANEALREFLSRQFRLAKSRVRILSGAASRNKRVLLVGLGMEAITARLAELLDAD